MISNVHCYYRVMSSMHFDKNLRESLRNVGNDSMRVLKSLMEEGDYDSIQDDLQFLQRATLFFFDEKNIWLRDRNGKYTLKDEYTSSLRDSKLADMSFDLGLEPERIRAIITRLFNAIRRTQRSLIGNPFKKAFTLTYEDIVLAIDEIFLEG